MSGYLVLLVFFNCIYSHPYILLSRASSSIIKPSFNFIFVFLSLYFLCHMFVYFYFRASVCLRIFMCMYECVYVCVCGRMFMCVYARMCVFLNSTCLIVKMYWVFFPKGNVIYPMSINHIHEMCFSFRCRNMTATTYIAKYSLLLILWFACYLDPFIVCLLYWWLSLNSSCSYFEFKPCYRTVSSCYLNSESHPSDGAISTFFVTVAQHRSQWQAILSLMAHPVSLYWHQANLSLHCYLNVEHWDNF